MMQIKYYKIQKTTEKGGWWRKDCLGYTDKINAGVFTEAETNELNLVDAALHVYEPTRLELKLMQVKKAKS